MTRRVLLIALGLSLLFNVFVLIGFARARTAAIKALDNQKEVEGRIARELNLNPEQERVLADLRADHRQQNEFYEESIGLVRQNLIAELRKENPDLAKVRELIEQEADLYKQRRQAGADLFGRFVGELTPQQRREMIGRFLNTMRGPHGQPNRPFIPKRVLEQFDKNRNGVLDPDEMHQAQQEMERRRERMRRGAPGMPPHPPGPPPHQSRPE